MATRPVFVPETAPESLRLIQEHEVDFQWSTAGGIEGKKINIARMHAAAGHRNLTLLLDVSRESPDPAGSRICPGNLAVEDDRQYIIPLQAAYQGSKVFASGGPYVDLYRKNEKEIGVDSRLTRSGDLRGFRFRGRDWSSKAAAMFYDWLVIQAIDRYPKLRAEVRQFKGFTELDCFSGDSSVCHARSCALYVALAEKKRLAEVLENPDLFIETLIGDPFFQSGGGP